MANENGYENRTQLYGNIKRPDVYLTTTDCGAFCACACACGFCIDYEGETEVAEADNSKLVASLIEAD